MLLLLVLLVLVVARAPGDRRGTARGGLPRPPHPLAGLLGVVLLEPQLHHPLRDVQVAEVPGAAAPVLLHDLGDVVVAPPVDLGHCFS